MKKKEFMALFAVILGMCLTSCSKNEVEDMTVNVNVTPQAISLYYKGTKQLTSTNATSWISEDEFVAKVDNNGVVTGEHVGTTKIIATNGASSASCVVTIVPKYNLYDTPVQNWGASPSEIKSKEKHELMSSESTSTSSMLAYNYTNESDKPVLLTYLFENGKLSRITVFVALLQYENAVKYLQERYTPIYAEKTDYFLMFTDAYTKDKMKSVMSVQITKVNGTELTTISYIPASEQ